MKKNNDDGTGIRHPRITAAHLQKKAIIYLRQSSQEQVKNHTGSQLYQRSQEDVAKAYGWTEDRIEIIGNDLGLSGTSADYRPGWQKMVADISRDLVGAIFVAEISRLSRNLIDLIQFCNLCRAHDVLIISGGRVIDSKDPNDLFLSKIFGSVMEYENHLRMSRMKEARYAKARDGKKVSPLPVGWIARPSGNGDYVFFYDPEVEDVIRLVIAIFREKRSIRSTVKELAARNVKLPSRYRRGSIQWQRPSVAAVASFLTNPAYAGVYVFGKTRSAPELNRTKKGRLRRVPLPESEWVVIYNHHPSYMTVEEQKLIKSILDGNVSRQFRPATAEALLQGLLVCDKCGHRLTVAHK